MTDAGHTGPTRKQLTAAIRLLDKALFAIERAQNSAAMRACNFVDQSSINSGKEKIMRQQREIEEALSKATEVR